MEFILLIIAVIILIFGSILLVISYLQKKHFGILTNEKIYQDTELNHGKTLYATTINLVGRPDYLLKEDTHIVPVEVKTGKTPSRPYHNHTMQLTAYCLLVEETYGVKPEYGYIKYPYKEFKVSYTEHNKQQLIDLVKQLSDAKTHKTSFSCKHPEHNFSL